MKGIVFNLLAETVVAEHGEDAWDSLLTLADTDGAYTSLGSYPDEEMGRLVAAAAAALALSPEAVLHWFGRKAMPRLAERYPAFFTQHHTARSFILSVNEIIHPEVRKLYAGAGCPNFHFGEQEGRLIVGYASPRRLCHLAHGFMEGAADHFGECVAVEHLACMGEGAAECRLAVAWLH